MLLEDEDEDPNKAPRNGIVGIDLSATGRRAGRSGDAGNVLRVALEKALNVRTRKGNEGRRMEIFIVVEVLSISKEYMVVRRVAKCSAN